MKDRIKNQFVEKGPTIDDDAWKMTATKRHEELSHLFCGRIVD